VVLVTRPKRKEDWWLIGFLGSLILSAVWGFLGPIFYGLEKYQILNTGDFLSRIFSLLGYVALFVYVLALKRRKVAD